MTGSGELTVSSLVYVGNFPEALPEAVQDKGLTQFQGCYTELVVDGVGEIMTIC